MWRFPNDVDWKRRVDAFQFAHGNLLAYFHTEKRFYEFQYSNNLLLYMYCTFMLNTRQWAACFLKEISAFCNDIFVQ